MKALIPAEPVTPADIHHPRQPAQTAALGIAGRDCRGIQRLVGTRLRLQPLDQISIAGDQSVRLLPPQAVELASIRQVGKGSAQVPLRIPIKAPFTGEALPLAKEG